MVFYIYFYKNAIRTYKKMDSRYALREKKPKQQRRLLWGKGVIGHTFARPEKKSLKTRVRRTSVVGEVAGGRPGLGAESGL